MSIDFVILLPLFAAILGSLITVIGNTIKENKKQKILEKQVESIMKESCKRVLVYLQAMKTEKYENALINLRYRIDGIETVVELISDFKLNNIIGNQIYVVFRIREQIQELLGDFKNFNENYFKVRQLEADINYLIKASAAKEEINHLEEEKNYHLKKLKKDYRKDHLRQIDDNISIFQTFIKEYNIIAKGIKEYNEKM